jgi:signal transduction histidine kinase
MRYLTLLTILLTLPILSVANKKAVDEDTAAVNRMVRDVSVVLHTNRDSAVKLNRAAYDLAKKLRYEEGIADAGWLLGTYEMNMGNYAVAQKYYDASIDIYQRLDRQGELADVYVLSGISQGMQEKSSKALAWFLKGLAIAERLHDARRIADINYKLGLVYNQVSDIRKAVEYTEKSLRFARQTRDTGMLTVVLNNLGLLYGQSKQYEKAIAILFEARAIVAKVGNNQMLPHLYQNIGSAYRELGVFDKSALYLDSALQIHQRMGYPKAIAGTLYALGELWVKKKDYAKALDYVQGSLKLAAELADTGQLYEDKLLLQKIYTAQGNYKGAALLMDTIFVLMEVAESAEERARVEQAAMAVEVEKAQEAMRMMEAEKEAQTYQRNVWIVISLLTLGLVGVAVGAILQIRKKNKQLQEQKAELAAANEMKDKMFAVISHDLRSPLNSIIGSLELLEADVLEERERMGLINSLHLSATATLETLDNLLQWGSGNFKQGARQEAVDVNILAEQTNRLLTNVASHKSVTLVQKIDDVCIARFDKSQLAFIMRNLVVNAIKFSHEGQQVELHGRKENGRIILQVKDYGVGMSEDVRTRLFNLQDRISERGTAGERGVGLGLILINEFLEKNDGRIRVTSKEGNGSCFEVDIPAV